MAKETGLYTNGAELGLVNGDVHLILKNTDIENNCTLNLSLSLMTGEYIISTPYDGQCGFHLLMIS